MWGMLRFFFFSYHSLFSYIIYLLLKFIDCITLLIMDLINFQSNAKTFANFNSTLLWILTQNYKSWTKISKIVTIFGKNVMKNLKKKVIKKKNASRKVFELLVKQITNIMTKIVIEWASSKKLALIKSFYIFLHCFDFHYFVNREFFKSSKYASKILSPSHWL